MGMRPCAQVLAMEVQRCKEEMEAQAAEHSRTFEKSTGELEEQVGAWV